MNRIYFLGICFIALLSCNKEHKADKKSSLKEVIEQLPNSLLSGSQYAGVWIVDSISNMAAVDRATGVEVLITLTNDGRVIVYNPSNFKLSKGSISGNEPILTTGEYSHRLKGLEDTNYGTYDYLSKGNIINTDWTCYTSATKIKLINFNTTDVNFILYGTRVK